MAFTLVVANVVEVPIRLTVADAEGASVQHAFSLQCKRMAQGPLREALNDPAMLTAEFLRSIATGWRGQNLVIDASNRPAEFSPEAFECMLSLSGFEQIAFEAYLAAMPASATPAGREKK